ncbi:MAG: TonB-dependent receptor, partial [Cytophagaceae bacterium]|nr:TonB-dependent receptor [Gemmatimonadaceae bacterium]
SQGRLEGAGDLLWRRGDLGLTLDGGARNIDLAPGVAGETDTYARRGNGLATVIWDARADTRLTTSLMGVLERQRYRVGQLYRFADNLQWAGRVAGERTSSLGRMTASMYGTAFQHLSRASTLDAPVSGSGDRDRQALWQGEFLWNAMARGVAIDAGTQLRHEQITADRVLDRRRDVSSVEPFVQATITSGAFSVVPGVRSTFSSQWGTFVAPRLAAMWRPRPEFALRASAGRGFRAPDFKELYLDFVNSAAGYAVEGNPDLRPERSTALSLGAELTGRRWWGRAGAWATDYRDFIETSEPDARGTYTYRNLTRGVMRGLELEGGLERGAWEVDVGADFLHSRDRTSGTALLGRAREVVRGSVSGPIAGSMRGTTSVVYTGRTPINRDLATNALLERGGWARVDARLTQPLPSGLTWSLGVTNLLDREMGTSWPGFTGRQFVTSLAWRGGPVSR